MQEQLKIVRSDRKGKNSAKVSTAMDEMQYLMKFNSSICQAAAKTMEHLTEFVFISMGNLTLARRDSYFAHIKSGVKPDTLAGLSTAPIHIATLFPDSVIKRAEEEIAHFESKCQSSSTRGKGRYHPYERPERKTDRKSSFKSDKPAWKNIGKTQCKRSHGKQHTTLDQPSQLCTQIPRRTAGWEPDINTRTLFRHSCKLSCCNSCSYCAQAFPKERIKSRVASLSCSNRLQIKICERCFLCHSIVLCKPCNKCQKFYLKSACRGQTSKLLTNLAGSGCRSEGASNPEIGLHPSLSDPAQSHKVSHSHKLLWQSSQEPLPVRGITSAYRQ